MIAAHVSAVAAGNTVFTFDTRHSIQTWQTVATGQAGQATISLKRYDNVREKMGFWSVGAYSLAFSSGVTKVSFGAEHAGSSDRSFRSRCTGTAGIASAAGESTFAL